MKRIILTLAVLLVSIGAMAQEIAEKYPSYIDVVGYAKMEVAPNQIYLSITIDEVDSKGKVSIESQEKAMIAALKKLKIDADKNLKVTSMLSDEYKRKSATTSANYELMVSSANDVARVYDALNRLEIDQIQVARTTHSDLKKFNNELRLKAIKNAEEIAISMAEAVDQKIGSCFYIRDTNYGNNDGYGFSRTLMSKVSGVHVESGDSEPVNDLEFQKIKIEKNISAKFVLRVDDIDS